MISSPTPRAESNGALKPAAVFITNATWQTAGSHTAPIPQHSAPKPISLFSNACKKIGYHLSRITMLLLLIIGVCTVFDETIGDGELPHFNNLKAATSDVAWQAKRNTTYRFYYQTDAKAWSALKPSRQLLMALSPEIAAWLYDMHRNQHIIYHAPTNTNAATYALPPNTPLIAAYSHLQGKLYLGRTFWDLSDGEKIAVLAHEYRHFRQNPPKRFSRQLAQLIGLGRLHYTSLIEDEAFAYEKQAQAALGL
jgi:hypothetical protein